MTTTKLQSTSVSECSYVSQWSLRSAAAESARPFRLTRLAQRTWLAGLGLAVGMALAASGSARADDRLSNSNRGTAAGFKICEDQTYALCAVASCFVFNEIAYCKCEVKMGKSISLPFQFDDGKDVCTVNAEGAANGYMVSTFSPAESVLAPKGDKAIYTCPAGTSDGAYAQCDGGICFTSTEGKSFPGFDEPLSENQIICSCPITQAKRTARIGYRIAGPYPCQNSFFRNCKRAVANEKTGATIYVGAPTGTARLLTRLLLGQGLAVNECPTAGLRQHAFQARGNPEALMGRNNTFGVAGQDC